jgi:hypothetical protein
MRNWVNHLGLSCEDTTLMLFGAMGTAGSSSSVDALTNRQQLV